MEIFAASGAHPNVARYQPFWIDDASVTALAKYHETGQTSMAVKNFKNYTSLYIAAYNGLDAQLINNIAQSQGAFVAGNSGEEVDMNSNFASVHGLKNAEYTLHLPPGKTRVIDALSKKVLSTGSNMYRFSVQAQETYWFLFE